MKITEFLGKESQDYFPKKAKKKDFHLILILFILNSNTSNSTQKKKKRGHLLKKDLQGHFFPVYVYEESNPLKDLTGVIINFHCLKPQGRKKLNQG